MNIDIDIGIDIDTHTYRYGCISLSCVERTHSPDVIRAAAIVTNFYDIPELRAPDGDNRHAYFSLVIHSLSRGKFHKGITDCTLMQFR